MYRGKAKFARAFVTVNTMGACSRTRSVLGCVGAGFTEAVLSILGVARSGAQPA